MIRETNITPSRLPPLGKGRETGWGLGSRSLFCFRVKRIRKVLVQGKFCRILLRRGIHCHNCIIMAGQGCQSMLNMTSLLDFHFQGARLIGRVSVPLHPVPMARGGCLILNTINYFICRIKKPNFISFVSKSKIKIAIDYGKLIRIRF